MWVATDDCESMKQQINLVREQAMSRKSYDMLAKAIKDASYRHGYDERQMGAVNQVAYKIALALRQDNPNFKIEKFMIACGL